MTYRGVFLYEFLVLFSDFFVFFFLMHFAYIVSIAVSILATFSIPSYSMFMCMLSLLGN